MSQCKIVYKAHTYKKFVFVCVDLKAGGLIFHPGSSGLGLFPGLMRPLSGTLFSMRKGHSCVSQCDSSVSYNCGQNGLNGCSVVSQFMKDT